MRLNDNARRSVVFVGFLQDPQDQESFIARATAFLMLFGDVYYLVTAAHVAFDLRDEPFAMRVNLTNGAAETLHFDPHADPLDRWFLHTDPSVDVAVMAFPYDLAKAGLDHLAISGDIQIDEKSVIDHDLGPGDTCYAVGLFRLIQGQKRNVPIVHRGSIAAMPSDEMLPIEDWTYQGPERPKPRAHVRAYLVEANNLKGLSGSPVFVRPTIDASAKRINIKRSGTSASISHVGEAFLSAPSTDVLLLGLWSGSWDASPSDVQALDHGSQARVPLGMGIVVPTERILELLNSEAVTAQRRGILAERIATTAAPPPVTE